MIELFIAEFTRTLILMIRYPVALFLDMFMNFAYFFCIFTGARYFAGDQTSQFGHNAGGMVLGYFIWMIIITGFGHVTQEIEREARSGTLENIFLSGHKKAVIFMFRSFAGITVCFLQLSIVVPLMILVTGVEISFPPGIIAPCLALIAATSGVGLMIGGGALIFKRFGDVLIPIQYAVLLLLMIPTESWPAWLSKVACALPGIPVVLILKQMMVFGGDFDYRLMIAALLNAAFYLLLGVCTFYQMVIYSKKRGLVSGY